ncbi:hypothetical protein VPHF86_0087 [Vibrio phage F86]
MIIFEETLLPEAFTRPAKYDWITDDEIFFEVGDTQYRAVLRTSTDSMGLGMDLSFQYRDESGQWSYKLKKGGDGKDAMTVLATILTASEERVKLMQPDVITFSAFSDEDDADARKRFKLYKRMAERYAKKVDYTLIVNHRSFILRNNNPNIVRRLPNDGIKRDEELQYVVFPKSNQFTWATLFGAERDGDFVMPRFTNGFAMIKRVNNDLVEIQVSNKKSLDQSDTWKEILGSLYVTASYKPEPFEMLERASMLEDGRMIILDGTTLFIVENVNDFENIWGYTFVEIKK